MRFGYCVLKAFFVFIVQEQVRFCTIILYICVVGWNTILHCEANGKLFYVSQAQ